MQLTPPGSACSIVIGQGIDNTAPGSVQGLHLVVSDSQAARAELVERGVEISKVQDYGGGISFAFFKDPDGNGWALQEIARGAHRPDDLDEAELRELMTRVSTRFQPGGRRGRPRPSQPRDKSLG